ncbi:MAG: 5-formyltetrahydrofolate cyclo-ligase [Cytophagaceae bacterium]|nr:5-formyltetrahydrofolate cyclo-ligase [Cytophagaceae bacterium]
MKTKAHIRKEALACRQALHEKEFKDLNQKLMDQMVPWILQHSAFSTLHIYLPMPRHREPDTWSIIHALAEAKPELKITVPVTDWEHQRMDSVWLKPDAKLQTDRFGISQPVGAPIIPADSLDLIIVPLLAFNQRLHRIGYGKGFYDRYLLQCKPSCQKIGLSFFDKVEFEEEPFDVALDNVFLPQKIYDRPV